MPFSLGPFYSYMGYSTSLHVLFIIVIIIIIIIIIIVIIFVQ